jgi:glycosyltransferase involved in cell wall biosynthesis
LYLSHFDGVVAFSDADRAILAKIAEIKSVFTSPFPIPSDVGIVKDIARAHDGRFLFLGAEEHGPNKEALAWLLRDIWPLILAQSPSARLEIIGRWSEGWKKTVTARGVVFKGFVPQLNEALHGGIMLVPLRVGSGIRTKILVSLAQGVPVISTPIGAEGLLVKDGQDIIIREDAASFAEAAVKLASQPEQWLKLAHAGRDAVSAHYSPEEVRRRRNEIYVSLSSKVGRERPTPSASQLTV